MSVSSHYVSRMIDDLLLRSLDWFRDCRFSDDSDFIANRFDKRLKPLFDDDGMNYQIQFGSPRDNDPDLRVQGGMLELDGYVLPELKLYNPALT